MLELHFFGRLGDLSGEIDTSIDYGDFLSTPSAIVDWIALEHPALAEELLQPQVLVAVNRVVVDWNKAVVDCDEVAFLPPVTGG